MQTHISVKGLESDGWVCKARSEYSRTIAMIYVYASPSTGVVLQDRVFLPDCSGHLALLAPKDA